MAYIDTIVNEYQEYIQNFKSSRTYFKYQELLDKKDDASVALREKMLKSPTMCKYSRVSKCLEIIANPITEDFMHRYNIALELGLNKKSLQSCKVKFDDEVPVRVWIEALIYAYKVGKLPDYYMDKANHLYNIICNKDYNQDLRKFIVALEFEYVLSDEELAEKLGVNEKIISKMKHSGDMPSLNYVNKMLVYADRNKDDFSKNTKLFNDFINYLESYRYSKRSVPEKNSNEQCVSKKVIHDFDLLIEKINNGQIKDFHKAVVNGWRISSWWKNYLEFGTFCNNEEEENIIVDKFNQILEFIYDDMCDNDFVNTNYYGYSLKVLMYSIGYTKEELFEATGIPVLLLNKIFKQEIVPDKKMIENILLFLSTISCVNNHQLKYLDMASRNFTNLLIDNKSSFNYNIYTISDIEKFEVKLDVDFLLLKEIKARFFDWYIKCVTFMLIIQEKNRLPNNDDYFYDGTSARRWMHTQKRTMDGINDCVKLSVEQQVLFDNLRMKKFELLRNAAKNNDGQSKNQDIFDGLKLYIGELNDHIRQFGKLPVDETVGDVLLRDVWITCNKAYRENWKILTPYYIDLIKSMKFAYVLKRNDNVGSGFAFGFYFSLFLEYIDVSYVDFSEMLECSPQLLYKYARGTNFPTEDILNKMLKVMEDLKKDKRSYVVDEIRNFELVINYVLDSKTYITPFDGFSSMTYGENDDVYLDVDADILNKVKKADKKWFDTFVKMTDLLHKNKFSDVSTYNKDDNYFYWFINNVSCFYKDDLSLEKSVLLNYLIRLNRRNSSYLLYARFKSIFPKLEAYIYENSVRPEYNDLILDGIDLRVYLNDIEKYYYRKNDSYWFLSDEDIIKVKKLLIFLASKKMEGFDTFDDMFGDRLFIGEHLEKLKISLRYTTADFAKDFHFNLGKLISTLGNNRDVSIATVERLISELSDYAKNDLRVDQLDDISEFIVFIKKLYTIPQFTLNLKKEQ